MEINRKLPLLALLALVPGCVAQQPAPPPPAPRPTPRVAAMAPPAPVDWRDAPLTPGDWTYRQDAGGSLAAFGEPGASPLMVLRCDRARGMVLLDRAGAASAPLPMTLVTTSMTRTLSATPASGNPPVLRTSFAAKDSALDAMAFSRGRFELEVNGLPTLIVPAWEEIDRVIEDCR
ncbi:MAG: hypothetical protein KGL48_08835 [Sphingomonadales bacterium]|nr:hypothetical protein [Sphingomonadales bacterium]MDE2568180.1 hypothetical protein [Sphingomonadales bacterium]